MPGVVRKQDNCSGHGCWPARPPIAFSPNVYTNNKNVVRFGDPLKTHCCPKKGCHSGVYCGNNNVYANNKPMQKKGDPITCGSKCQQCSGDVFIG